MDYTAFPCRASNGPSREPARSGRDHGWEMFQGALHPSPSAIEDVRVDHGGGDVGVSEKLLDRPKVIAALQQMGRE